MIRIFYEKEIDPYFIAYEEKESEGIKIYNFIIIDCVLSGGSVINKGIVYIENSNKIHILNRDGFGDNNFFISKTFGCSHAASLNEYSRLRKIKVYEKLNLNKFIKNTSNHYFQTCIDDNERKKHSIARIDGNKLYRIFEYLSEQFPSCCGVLNIYNFRLYDGPGNYTESDIKFIKNKIISTHSRVLILATVVSGTDSQLLLEKIGFTELDSFINYNDSENTVKVLGYNKEEEFFSIHEPDYEEDDGNF